MSKITLVKNTDTYQPKKGRRSKNEPDVENPEDYPLPNDSAALTQLSRFNSQHLFLEFRALLYSDIYSKYARLKLKDDSQFQQTELDYPNIKQVYNFWGALNNYSYTYQQEKGFNNWVSNNLHKLQQLNEHHITADINGRLTLPLPFMVNLNDLTNNSEFKEGLIEFLNNHLVYKAQSKANASKYKLAEQILDVYSLKKFYKSTSFNPDNPNEVRKPMSSSQCLQVVMASGKSCWREFDIEFANYDDGSSTIGVECKINDLMKKADKLISQALNNHFPYLSSSSST